MEGPRTDEGLLLAEVLRTEEALLSADGFLSADGLLSSKGHPEQLCPVRNVDER